MPLDQEGRSRMSAPAIGEHLPASTGLVIRPRCEDHRLHSAGTAAPGQTTLESEDATKRAGMRIRPPSASLREGDQTAATAAASLDPPGVFWRFHGLNEGPGCRSQVAFFNPSFEVLVFPS